LYTREVQTSTEAGARGTSVMLHLSVPWIKIIIKPKCYFISMYNLLPKDQFLSVLDCNPQHMLQGSKLAPTHQPPPKLNLIITKHG
jgi:hypothetical protein